MPASRSSADFTVDFALSSALTFAAGLTLAAPVAAQTIQRCESADGRISYSDTACPPGSQAVRALAAPERPSPAARKQARERVERDLALAAEIEARRRPARAPARAGATVVAAEEVRRAADCAYLRAELDANRRLRALLTTRAYYSLDDVETLDAREAGLAADLRRFCTRAEAWR